VERFQYLLLMAGCLACTLPLEFVYDAGVWRRPRRLLATLAIPVALFTVADVLAIEAGLWSFDPRWTTGWLLPFDVPVEEVAFFFVVPICAILAYEAVRRTLEGR
jgi:lycopene cyclase domain-containing protein